MRHAFIISYLPINPALRTKRLANHKKQLFILMALGFRVTVFAQGYAREDYTRHARIKYIDGPAGKILPPGAARNVLLEEFYSSDVDFAIFADDDAALYDHCDGVGAALALLDNPSRFPDIDLAVPINPRNQPFNKMYRENQALFQENWCFKSTANIKGSLMVLRNYRNTYGRKYFFDAAFNQSPSGGFLGGEDGDFALELIRDGLGVYTFQNCVLKEFGGDGASTWAQETSLRNQQRPLLDAVRLKKFGPHGLECKSGRFNWKKFWEKNSTLAREIHIPK